MFDLRFDIRLDNITTTGETIEMVYLPHEPEDSGKIIRLREQMMLKGWVGRPVVLIDCGDHHEAVSGCHRLAAIAGLDVEINAIVIGNDDINSEEYEMISSSNDDDDRLQVLEEIVENGNTNSSVLAALAAIREEVESNND